MRINEILSEDFDVKSTLSSIKDKVSNFFSPNSSNEKSSTLSVPPGNRGVEVADVQKALLALGSATSKDLGNLGPKKDGVDGILGPLTAGALQKFQAANKLPGGGRADKATIDALNSALAAGNITIVKSTTADVARNALRGQGPSAEDLAAIQSPEFNEKLNKIGQKLGVDPKDLLRIMKFETAGSMSPSQGAGTGGAVGLIQFMPQTARDLGTTSQDLARMSAVEQLDYVYKFYKMNGVQPGMGVGDLYMLTFMPAAINKPDDFVLGDASGGKVFGLNKAIVWDQNPVFGKSKGKSYFTAGDVRQTIERRA
jgi:peptidoglycan hydrolase-like protein with peptidoglycan-binding domain